MFTSLSRTIGNVFEFSLPMIIISVVVAITLRVADIVKNKREFCFYKELIALSFIIYILCLFQVVTFQDNNNISSNNLIPFREMFRYDLGSRLFLKNVLGNIIMFLPYGFFTSYFLKEKKLLPIFILTAVASLTIESTQLMIGRVFDIDDILLNIVGGILGHYLYIVILKIGDMCPRVLQREWFLNLVSIILLVGLITLL
ncbi:MAG TPA: VanZ family protein [Candidatus Onthousia excrementipullorum]|uniref:VanZ family protein n=1 Tax=Candidatus Onthousia excrementipullorum TaxID=2840884 RepID=A0A9D1DW12_9FIRM|nr:VanZ family protein [Candidatus Onthousia excrementipullorum]